MRNLIAGFIAVVIGMFTLFFAAIMGLFVSVATLITKPFLKRKLAYADYAYQEQGFTDSRFGDARQEKTSASSNVIDGEFEDITDRK
ncbi:TPA: hypothetical protein ACX6QX_002933 [Photobacterium damselae]